MYPAVCLQAQSVLSEYGSIVAGKLNLWDKEEFANATLTLAKQIDSDSTIKFKLTNKLDADLSITHQFSP